MSASESTETASHNSAALSLFDQLKNSVNHNAVSTTSTTSNTSISSSSNSHRTETSTSTSTTTTATEEDKDVTATNGRKKASQEWRKYSDADDSTSEKSIKLNLEQTQFHVGGVVAKSTETTSTTTTATITSSSSSSSALLATIAADSHNPLLACSQPKESNAEQKPLKWATNSPSMDAATKSSMSTPTTSSAANALDFTLQKRNCNLSNANIKMSTATASLATTTLAAVTGTNACSSSSSSSKSATIVNTLTDKANTNTANNSANQSNSGVNKSVTASSGHSTATGPSVVSAVAATIVMPETKTTNTNTTTSTNTTSIASQQEFPTPSLPPPAPPPANMSVVNNSHSHSSSIGIVHGTKRSTPTAPNTTAQFSAPANVVAHLQQTQTHTFGLPHANVVNAATTTGVGGANYSTATGNGHKMDTAYRSQNHHQQHHHNYHHLQYHQHQVHQIAHNNNKKTATAAGLRNADGSHIVCDIASKKKRCADRYDSSESSDSGVATSLSCTDSSTGSSEDASEPGSPYSPQSNLGDEHHHHQQVAPASNNNKKMPPQTILAASSNSGGSTSNGINTSTHTTTTATTVTTGTNNSNNSNNNNHTAKLKQQLSQPKSCNTATPRSTLPTLQWAWNSTPTATASSAAPITTTASGATQNKKRNAANTPTDGAAKKSRASAGTAHTEAAVAANNAASGANALKRLKAAALEESQTKITGYFKSQMKAQIHQSGGGGIGGKRSEASSSGMNTNSLTMSTPATTASLNKYFNILSQLKENNSSSSHSNNRDLALPKSALPQVGSNLVAAAPVAPPPPPPVAPTHVAIAPATSMPVPALKKIERSKPTKIAQVAPNLRKTPSSGSYASTVAGKSPAKKHVAIAPRTPEMKQQQQQQQQLAAAGKAAADSANAKHMMPSHTNTTQPAMLLAAIRLPTQQQQTSGQMKQPSPPKMSTPATPNAVTNPTLYQLPVQLPNLVQLPQLLAPNGANIMQLNNVAAKSATSTTAAGAASTAQAAAAAQYFLNGTVFKLQQFTTATTTTATSAVATAAANGATANPFNLMSTSDLQDMFLKHQLQQQQQHLQLQQQQQQKVAAATATAAANNASFQEIFQQQIAAAIAANQQQQQQQQFQQLQRLGAAAATMQQQPVFMATPAGLLLNAASLPMLAQAAAALAVNNNQQQQKTVSLQQPQQLPALQPIQQNPLPALSSIFASNAQQQQHQHEQHELHQQHQQQQQQFHHQQQLAQLALAQHQHQQYITATQPPPLSAVSINTNSNNNTASNSNCGGVLSSAATASQATSPTAKLAIVKASSSNAQFSALNSQPPPLVTISTPKVRTQVTQAPIVSNTLIKPSILTKPYQKRSPKAAAQPKPIASSKAKISSAGGKIIASPTSPPPLVPASSMASKELSSIRTTPVTVAAKPASLPNVLPTPALVSIVSAPPAPPAVKLSTNLTVPIAPKTPPQSVKHAATAAASTDLFDLVKNSNGAITITAAMCSTPTAPSAANFIKIKEEPLEEPTETSTDSGIKAETATNYSSEHAMPADIKLELMEDSTKMCSSQPNNSMNHECSSSSFSSHSNSISSAADLSLEASTAASLTSSCSSAPSPAPSVPSPRHSPPLLPLLPTCGASSASDSNSSNSCTTSATASRASSQDMLSEMVTSSCISSASSVSNLTVTIHANAKQQLDADKDMPDTDKRDLPTPESGIGQDMLSGGGSLSNSESSNSIVSAISISTSKSAKSILDAVATISSSDISNSPPPTPRASSSTSSQSFANNFLRSNATSPASLPDAGQCELATLTSVPSPAATIISSTSNSTSTPTTIDTQLAEASPKCAISPILSQPKTIRFPAASGFRYGHKGAKRHDGVCYWDKCNKKHDSSSKLLDHMQSHHVNSQTGPFACLWVGCKVYNKESCSRRWLERHVLSHGGSKQFKCIVEGCGLRFGSQLALQKHVNNHFTATENKESTNKRTSDPPVPKQLRKNGKKLRYRRQPFSARMFDFFDAGIMEGLQHRLRQINLLTKGSNSITFKGQTMMRRKSFEGTLQCFVRWSPSEIIADEWLPESTEPYIKTVNIKQMKPAEKIKVESLLMAAYKLPYSPNLFENDYALSQNGINNDEDEDEEKEDEEEEEDNDDDDDDDEDDNDTAVETDTTSSYQQVLTIAKLQMQQRTKHPRKPQKRMGATRR